MNIYSYGVSVMKKYILKDLDCPVCAQKIEDHLNKCGYKATVSFVNKCLYLDKEESLQTLNKLVQSVEDEVEVLEEEIKEENKSIVPFILSALLLVCGFLLGDSGFSSLMFIGAYICAGYNVIIKAVKNVIHKELFDECFLMTVATVAALCIGEFWEAVMVMLLFEVGELIQDKAVESSRKSVSNLLDIDAKEVTRVINSKEEVIHVDNVNIGDIVLVKQGERIALDGIVVEGEATLDTCSITGESVPVTVKVDDNVMSGCINVSGFLYVKVTSLHKDSTVSRILQLIEESASRKTNTERFITRFSKVYTPVVVGLALLVGVIPPLFGASLSSWIYRAIVFLVVSCPCALVISVPLAFYMGIGACSRNGILVKGNNYLELLSKCNCVCFDKTGTITTGKFDIKELKLYEIEEKELIECVLCAEKGSLHPFAESFKDKYNNYEYDAKMTGFKEEKGKGVSCNVNGKVVLVGNDTWMKENNVKFEETKGIVMYVSIDGIHKGTIVLEDEIKEDAYIFVDELKKRNVNEIMMLSGDKKDNVISVARVLDIKSKGELLPEDKLNVVKELKEKGNTCLYIGDGINDAPVLVESNVGVSMGNFGSDAAIECSDIVIVDDNPYKIIKGMEISKKTKKVLWTNIIFALSIKFVIMVLAMFGISSLPLAIFGDVGVTLLTILNCLRIK